MPTHRLPEVPTYQNLHSYHSPRKTEVHSRSHSKSPGSHLPSVPASCGRPPWSSHQKRPLPGGENLLALEHQARRTVGFREGFSLRRPGIFVSRRTYLYAYIYIYICVYTQKYIYIYIHTFIYDNRITVNHGLLYSLQIPVTPHLRHSWSAQRRPLTASFRWWRSWKMATLSRRETVHRTRRPWSHKLEVSIN